MRFIQKIIEKLYLNMSNNLVYYDSVTACKSRYYFDNIARKKYREKEYCIVYVDIDNLKQINDTRGHSYGTEIIKYVGRSLLQLDNVYDICRIGGDEFVLICDKQINMFQFKNINYITYSCYQKRLYEDVNLAVNKADKEMYIKKKQKYLMSQH